MTSLTAALSTIGERAEAASRSIECDRCRGIGYAGNARCLICEGHGYIIANQDIPKLLAVIDALIEQRNKCIAKYSDNAFDAKRERDSADAAILFTITATESKGEQP